MRCDFCYHQCSLEEGEVGLCGIRENKRGIIKTIGYGEIVASAVDPIEKKPMYHFFPGSKTFSLALFGCNFRCKFCQNHRISQIESPYYPKKGSNTPFTSSTDLLKIVEKSNSKIVSYTYSDPIVWQDYMIESAALLKERGFFTCMVTNGSFSKASLQRVLPHIDAFNIDVKGSQPFYKEYCDGSLKPTLDAIEVIAHDPSKVLEVTTLLIEGVHSEKEIVEMATQLAKRGVKVWHLSRFFPTYKMRNYKATSEHFLERILERVQDVGIPYIYGGNSALLFTYETRCVHCNEIVIKRSPFSKEAIVDGVCGYCGEPIYGRFRA